MAFITKDSGEREGFETGAVRDVRNGKGRYDLISPFALKRLADVYERGAVKYADRNWEKGMPLSRALDSALRHTFQYIQGMRDEDHLAQAAWNLFAVMHYEEMIAIGALPAGLNDLPEYDVCKDDAQVQETGVYVEDYQKDFTALRGRV